MDEDIARTIRALQSRKGGLKGGPARKDALTARERSEIARTAAEARWGKPKKKTAPKKRVAAKRKGAA